MKGMKFRMNTEYKYVIVDRVGTDQRVGRITLNRPEVLNALSMGLKYEVDQALLDFEADTSVRVVIIRGAGRAFSAGHDLKPEGVDSSEDYTSAKESTNPYRDIKTTDSQGRPLAFNLTVSIAQGREVQLRLWNLTKPVIVQAHGFCLAGAMELAMMADLVTASEDCLFGHPGHRGLGVARNGMILPLVIGMRKAKELFLTGDPVTGVQAEEMGLINYAWPADELDERTIALADRVANNSADFLGVLKAGVNGFYESMGMMNGIARTTQLTGLVGLTEGAYAFGEKMSEGLREALLWRDGPYGDYTAKKKSSAPAEE